VAIDTQLLGKAIRQMRELRGVSQAALAEMAGLQGNSVALIERGERGVSLETLNGLARVLDVPAACLAMLGTSEISNDANSRAFVASLQKLILATLVAQATVEAQEAAEKDKRHRIEKATRSLANIVEQHVKHLALKKRGATRSKAKATKRTPRKSRNLATT